VVGQWLVFGWFWGCGTSDTQLARRKLGKNNTPQPWRPPSLYDLHGAPPRRSRIRQSANMLRNKSISLKLENVIVFTFHRKFYHGESMTCEWRCHLKRVPIRERRHRSWYYLRRNSNMYKIFLFRKAHCSFLK